MQRPGARIPIVLDPDPYCPGSLMSLMSWIPNVLLKNSKSKKILYGLESNSQNLDFDGFLKKKVFNSSEV